VRGPLRHRWIALALSAGTLACTLAAGAEELEQTWEVAPDVHVDVQIVSGSIELRGIDAEQVHVRAQGGRLEVEGSRDWLTLRGPGQGFPGWPFGGGDVELEIELPLGSRITARTINGPIEVENVDGVLDLHAANGSIAVEGAPREAHLETLNAAIEFRGDGSEVVARTLNGAIELSGVAREVEATSMSGHIRVEGDDLERAELRSMAGDIELLASLAPGARIHGKTYSGQVRLRLPADTSARFDVETFSGAVHSELVGRIDGKEGRRGRWMPAGPGHRLHFVVGEGDARVAIDSFSGGVRIETDEGEARERRAERRERRRERLEERRERRRERAHEKAEREHD
jgi:hypothetical protein